MPPTIAPTPPSSSPPADTAPAPLVSGGVGATRRLRLPRSVRREIRRFDDQVDCALDRFRGHHELDRAMYIASELGDFSLIWHLLGAARAVRSEHHLREGIRLSAILGAESLLVNGLVKSFFNRTRPEWNQHRPHRLRRPRSSSFPSGHASAAFTAAAVLSHGRRTWPMYYGLATFVATSRVYVRIHHGSDVVAGALAGAALGHVAGRLWPPP